MTVHGDRLADAGLGNFGTEDGVDQCRRADPGLAEDRQVEPPDLVRVLPVLVSELLLEPRVDAVNDDRELPFMCARQSSV